MIWWEGVKNFARAVWEGLKTFVSAVCFHLFFLVVAPFLILLWGFVMSDTVARYVALSGREWKLEGINFILVSVVLATCTIGLYLYYLRRRHRILYGLMELAISVVLIGVSLALAWENILPSDVPQLSEKDFSVLKLVPWVAKLNIVLPIAAAIYVFVRGLDNIGEGLKRFPVMAAQWDDAFPTPEIAKEREARNNK